MSEARKPLGNRKRFKILQRDGHQCVYCGSSAIAGPLEVDHVVPVASGGTNDEENLVTSCRSCNKGKRDHPLESPAPRDYAQLADDAETQAQQIRRYRRRVEALRKEIGEAIDLVGSAYWGEGLTWNPDGHGPERATVELFLGKVGILEVIDAARIAASKRQLRGHDGKWKYFCATVIRKAEERGIRVYGDA